MVQSISSKIPSPSNEVRTIKWLKVKDIRPMHTNRPYVEQQGGKELWLFVGCAPQEWKPIEFVDQFCLDVFQDDRGVGLGLCLLVYECRNVN